MKLSYHTGKNFGDALNPLLFEKLLPGFFDSKTDQIFLGIGSILGWVNPDPACRRIIIFSSGFADGDASTYGKAPVFDERFDIICVRGKKTAARLGISESLAVADGALLLPKVFDFSGTTKKYAYSYMPHVGSLDLFDQWEKLLKKCNIHLINPAGDVMQVLKELNETEVLFAEAMHGAIAADAYQVPWVPVKMAKAINTFKWQDYTESVSLSYEPHVLPVIYSKAFIAKLMTKKLKRYRLSIFALPATMFYYGYQQLVIRPRVIKTFRRLKLAKTYGCSKTVLESKQEQLMQLLHQVKEKYAN